MADAAASLSVLIVDDHERTRAVLATLVDRLGFGDVVGDGVEALARLRERAFDLVLCDYHMAPWDGFELKRRMDADGMAKDVAFVLVTADSDFDVIERAVDAGIDVLIKPFKPATLVNVLNRNLGAERMALVLGS